MAAERTPSRRRAALLYCRCRRRYSRVSLRRRSSAKSPVSLDKTARIRVRACPPPRAEPTDVPPRRPTRTRRGGDTPERGTTGASRPFSNTPACRRRLVVFVRRTRATDRVPVFPHTRTRTRVCDLPGVFAAVESLATSVLGRPRCGCCRSSSSSSSPERIAR